MSFLITYKWSCEKCGHGGFYGAEKGPLTKLGQTCHFRHAGLARKILELGKIWDKNLSKLEEMAMDLSLTVR
jgi:hypothetical protein